jgi:PAS domain S-box-containing protein/putative nucleotidyltransferase with HDIG domain
MDEAGIGRSEVDLRREAGEGKKRRTKSAARDAFILAFAYWLIAMLWVGFSDSALTVIGLPLGVERLIAAVKGQAFVLATALILFGVARWHLRTLYASEKRYRESQNRLALTIRAGRVGLFDWDLATNQVYYSSEWKRQLGFSDDDISNDFHEWDSRVHPDDLEAAKARVDAYLADPMTGYSNEFRMRTKSGEYRWILAQASLITNENGVPIRLLGCHIDITDRKIVEEKTARQAAQLQVALDDAVMAMSNLVQSRDPYTTGHERRVAELAAAIANELGGWEPERIHALRTAGVLHDVGKIGIPAEILTRPGQLSHVDFALVKEHSRIGFEVVEHVDFGYPVAKMILQHHERMDGSGYPAGLVGDEILLEARILAVADVVEAMASHRPYRAALGLDAALDELRANCGEKYDPEVVLACMRLFCDKGFAFSEAAYPGHMPAA